MDNLGSFQFADGAGQAEPAADSKRQFDPPQYGFQFGDQYPQVLRFTAISDCGAGLKITDKLEGPSRARTLLVTNLPSYLAGGLWS